MVEMSRMELRASYLSELCSAVPTFQHVSNFYYRG